MPQDSRREICCDNEDEPRNETVSPPPPRRDCSETYTTQEPTDPDWEIARLSGWGLPNWLMTLATSTSTDKSLKDFVDLMSTLIVFSGYILNGLKIENLSQEILLGPTFRLLKGTRSNYAELEYDFEECYKALLEKLDWENPEGGDYPFDLSKPLPLITRGNRQRVPFEFFINNNLKYLQGGILTMTYTTSTTKTKAAKYDLPSIEDMVPNIWSPVKVVYDRYALWGISYWREQLKSFYAYARGMQSRGDVYSIKCILVVTHVKVMRKHGYRYLEEIVVRRADNNRLTNLLGDDVTDFTIALRMFTRSLASFFTRRHNQKYRHGVLAKEKMEQFEEEKSLFHDQGHQQAAKGKEDDEEFGEICWRYKAVRLRFSDPMIQPELEGSTQGYPLVSVEVLRNVRIKGENPSAGSDRGLKKRKTSKDTKPTTGLKNKDSMSGSSKGTKSQPKSTRKSVPSEELVFEVADSDMPQDQVGNLGDNEDEPRDETASRRDWFKKPKPPQEPTDPDGNIGKTTKEGPTQTWLINLAASNPTDKSLKDFDELISTPIDFSGYILNGLKIENLTQEILLGPAFKLLKGTHSNYAELEYDFEECYKALSEKLNWQGSDYPFDLSKPLPLITCGNRQRVPFEFFINNDLKYLQGAISTMTYTTSTTKIKAAKYDLPGIEDMSFYAYARGIQSRRDVYSTKRIPAVTHVKVMRKHGYGYLEEIVVRRADNALYRFKEGDDLTDFTIALRMFTRSVVIQKRVEYLQLGVKSYQKQIKVTKPDTTRPYLKKGTRTLHTKTFKDSFMSTNSRGTGHQQAAKGKEDDEEFGEIWWR
ncbi:hypothetical protein Tco_0670427 [Tanacetum coccineum]